MNEINRLLGEMEQILVRITKIKQDFIHKLEMAKIRRKNKIALRGIDLSEEFLRSKARALTKEEMFEQRVSWIYGQSKGISKEQIRKQLLGE